jgi:hypothetical protein
MKFVLLILLFISSFAHAQLRPAQSQYLEEKGAFINPGFEQGKKGWTLANGTFGFGDTDYLNKNATLTVISQVLDFSQFTTNLTDFAGSQGLASCRILSSVSGLKFKVQNNSGTVSELSVASDSKWRNYEIPFVIDGTLNAIRIESDAATVATIQVDDCSLGLAPKGYIQQVAQAHWVGALEYATINAGCSWETAAASADTWEDFPIDADCGDPTAYGGVLASTTSSVPRFRIANARTDGRYVVVVNGDLRPKSSTSGAVVAFKLTDGTDSSNTVNTSSGSSFLSVANSNTFNYKSTSMGDVEIKLQAKTSSTGNAPTITVNNTSKNLTFHVYFYPESNATIVSQDAELTINQANEFTAKVNSAGVVSGENYDWINGNCNTTTVGKPQCTINSGVFTSAPSCHITRSVTSGTAVGVIGQVLATTTLLDISTVRDDRNFVDTDYQITCTRTDDYKKSATIIGKFENINSSDLCQVIANDNDGEAITANTEDIPFKTTVYDNCGLWGNSGNTGSNTSDAFTPNKDGMVSLSFTVLSGTGSNTAFDIYEDGSQHSRCGTGTSSLAKSSSCLFRVTAGSYYTLRTALTDTLSSSALAHEIRITELPDTESIVKNLLAESSQTKCQTKYLTSDVTTDTDPISDLTFSNLTVGKKYKINGSGYLSVSGDSIIVFQGFHDGNLVMNLGAGSASGAQNFVNFLYGKFTATATTLTFNTASFGGTNPALRGNSTKAETYVELCQLPDSYTTTSQW